MALEKKVGLPSYNISSTAQILLNWYPIIPTLQRMRNYLNLYMAIRVPLNSNS